MSTGRRSLFATVALLMLGLLAWRIAVAAQRVTAPIEVDLAFTAEPETAWAGTGHLVVDARAGHRPRRSFVTRSTAAPLGAPDQVREVTRWTSAQGLVGEDDLGGSIPGPRVLVLGDDLTMGGVPAGATWPARLEAALRARGERLATTTVLNAACDQYGLVHHVLRGPELVARYAPRVVILAISTGDDVVALDDRRLPHLDDAAIPAGPVFALDADPLALGARAVALCPSHPELARLCSDAGRELLVDGVNEWVHAGVVEALEGGGVGYVDLLEELRTAAGPDVYRTDGRLGEIGHRTVAEVIAARVENLIKRR